MFGMIGKMVEEMVQDAAADQAAIHAAAEEAYDNSMSMAGTEGQMAILSELAVSDYVDVAEGIAAGDASGEDLLGLVSHPEAVEEILSESGQILEDAVQSAMGISSSDEEEEEEEW